MSPIRVRQFSDTHFSDRGRVPYDGLGYDPIATFTALLDGLGPSPVDFTVVTGDLADRGEVGEYEVVAQQLSRLAGPVHVLPGNHDSRPQFERVLGPTGLRLDRVSEIGPWGFLFADSNGPRPGDESDPNGDSKGVLSDEELAGLDRTMGGSDAEHLFVWIHHPPCRIDGFHRADYLEQFTDLVGRHPRLRGIGAGHVHTDRIEPLGSAEVHLCPSLTTSIDLDGPATMPPGLREYRFHGDGRIESAAVLADRAPWNDRQELPPEVMAWLAGEIDGPELKRRLGFGDA